MTEQLVHSGEFLDSTQKQWQLANVDELERATM